MSYAIIRNDKLTRVDAQGSYIHNDRRSKGHSNKDIDPTRTHLNFYCKENKLTYIKEFDRMRKEYDLKGNIRSNSIIICEMMITSDNEFFDKIGLEETKRYFRESYKFVCNYKNLGEKNIVSAAVHLDETTPHMHLVYIPVVKTKDKEGKTIDKICARDFWRGRNSYRELQNDFHSYVTSKGFDLERGLLVEETGAKHQKIEDLKKITNFDNTKKVLDNIKLELPKVPDINDIKLLQLNKAKVENDIIKPKDDLINELYNDNKALHQELSKQVKLVNEAEKYQKERDKILEDNKALNNKVKDLELNYNNRKNELEDEYKNKEFDIEYKYKHKIKILEKENSHLHKINEEKLMDKTLTTTKGKHEIKVSDIFNGTTIENAPLKPYTLAETMGGENSPNISGFNVENTYYVTWGTTAPYQPNETSKINNAPPSGWSNYNGKEWANIKTTGGGNDCYWVWIPRYAYKVPTKGNTAETIEIAFLKGTGSTIDDVIDETKKTEIETAGGFKTTPTPGNWVIHPAFTNAGNGGIGNLTGMWVAKFEASSSNVSEATVASDLTTTGGGDVTSLQVRVKPNVTSWRGIRVNNIFTVCRNLTTSGNSLENTSNLNSHMMKNTEWGAVAYLSMSVYGKNSEVWNNPYYNNTTNYSPITGLCSNESNGKDNATTDINKTYKYNEKGGGNASTTGNVYGVYDMAGGAWEYVAGIYKGTTSDSLGNNSNRSNLWDSSNSKYVDQYTETTGSQSTYYGT